MPQCSKQKNNNGIEIVFEEDTHKYYSIINNKTIDYISGTTFVSKFFPKFDPDGKIAERCAKRDGVTVESILAKWKKNADDSCIMGTKMHSICESIMKGEKYIIPEALNLREKCIFENAVKVANKVKERIDILGVEKIVFDPYLKVPIAGTIDLLGRSKKNGKILILDWKSNTRIDLENRYNKFGLSPISHIADINKEHYALQTSLYQHILISGGYFPKDTKFDRFIIHINENGSKIYGLNDYTKEIGDMINEY